MCTWSHVSTGTSGNWGCVCTYPNCPHNPNQIVEVTTGGWAPTEGTFEWALKQIREGRAVRRKSWSDKECYIYIQHGERDQSEDTIRAKGASIDEVSWETQGYQLLSTDWEIYDKRCGECGQPKP